MISGLAFVPPADVAQSFEELSDYLPDRLQPVLDYVEDNCIGRINRRGVRRTATFEIGLWNMCDRVVTDSTYNQRGGGVAERHTITAL